MNTYLEILKHFAKNGKQNGLELKLVQTLDDHGLEYPPPKNSKEFDIEQYYAAGVIRKSDLVNEGYYVGLCRNANVAQWDEYNQEFIYIRWKLGGQRLDTIKHLEDEQGTSWDAFVPLKYIGPDVLG